MTFLIGPAGIGNGIDTLPELSALGMKLAEVAFVHSIYMTNEKAKLVGEIAKANNVTLTIHAPYYINLNSIEKAKITASKKRILDTCERGHHLDAKYIVFHPGYVGKMTKEETFENIKNQILEIQDKIKENKWNVKLAPETTGKISVFGNLDETLRLAKETKTRFTIDFSHLKARKLGNIDYEEVIKELKGKGHVHAHYSGIEWTDKGEKRHIPTDFKEAKVLLTLIKKYKLDTTLISEAPDCWGDALKLNKILNEI